MQMHVGGEDVRAAPAFDGDRSVRVADMTLVGGGNPGPTFVRAVPF